MQTPPKERRFRLLKNGFVKRQNRFFMTYVEKITYKEKPLQYHYQSNLEIQQNRQAYESVTADTVPGHCFEK
jgi:hypothetical protein